MGLFLIRFILSKNTVPESNLNTSLVSEDSTCNASVCGEPLPLITKAFPSSLMYNEKNLKPSLMSLLTLYKFLSTGLSLHENRMKKKNTVYMDRIIDVNNFLQLDIKT
jgi:hypothetical protein